MCHIEFAWLNPPWDSPPLYSRSTHSTRSLRGPPMWDQLWPSASLLNHEDQSQQQLWADFLWESNSPTTLFFTELVLVSRPDRSHALLRWDQQHTSESDHNFPLRGFHRTTLRTRWGALSLKLLQKSLVWNDRKLKMAFLSYCPFQTLLNTQLAQR